MVIKTLDKTYTVIREMIGQYSIDRYICREDETEVLATLICIRDKDVIRSVVDFLMQQHRSRTFADFKDCFFFEGALYAAFAYKEGESVSAVLAESEALLEQRLVMLHSVLEKMMLLAMPNYFMWDALDRTQVIFTEDLEVFFQYGFWKITDYESFSFALVQEQFGKLFEVVFAEELIKESVPRFLDFLQLLKKGYFEDLPELFTAYDRLMKEVLAEPESDSQMPKTWPFRLWDAILAWFPTVKRIIVAVCVKYALLVSLIFC